MMTQCKITVLKRLLLEDLAAEYGPTGLGKYDMHEEGQEYVASLS
jgi:hypothetical protein